MQKPTRELVYNRTSYDITSAINLVNRMIAGTQSTEDEQNWISGDVPGALTYSTLNRIETWTQYLNNYLNECGYNSAINSIKTNWTSSDYFYPEDQNRIRSNIDALQNGFASLPDWKEITYTATMDYTQANAIEWDLSLIYLWLVRMTSYVIYSGETYCGGIWAII